MVVKTKEGYVDRTVALGSFYIPVAAASAFWDLKDSIYSVSCIHNIDFRVLMDKHMFGFDESIF